jgi:hypothetical protein
MNKQIILDVKVLAENNLSINEFLCLLKIYFSELNENIDYDDLYFHYQSLESKKFIKITIKEENERKEIKYILREKSKVLIENSFTDKTVSVKKDSIKKKLSQRYINEAVENGIDEYRKQWQGLKPGSMGSPKSCKDKLKRWMLENPEYTFENILKAVSIYINQFNGDYRFLQQADYFIFKRDGKEESSRLSAFIDEIDLVGNKNENWTNTLN